MPQHGRTSSLAPFRHAAALAGLFRPGGGMGSPALAQDLRSLRRRRGECEPGCLGGFGGSKLARWEAGAGDGKQHNGG